MAEFVAIELENAQLLEVSGDFGRADIDRLQERLRQMNGSIAGGAVIVDLSGVKRIDSGGMRALSNAHQALAQHGIRQIVTGLSGDVREALCISGVEKLLETTETVDAALAALAEYG